MEVDYEGDDKALGKVDLEPDKDDDDGKEKDPGDKADPPLAKGFGLKQHLSLTLVKVQRQVTLTRKKLLKEALSKGVKRKLLTNWSNLWMESLKMPRKRRSRNHLQAAIEPGGNLAVAPPVGQGRKEGKLQPWQRLPRRRPAKRKRMMKRMKKVKTILGTAPNGANINLGKGMMGNGGPQSLGGDTKRNGRIGVAALGKGRPIPRITGTWMMKKKVMMISNSS